MNINWLEFAKKVLAISVSGLTYCKNEYDIERYEELKELSIRMLANLGNTQPEIISQLFTQETGYQTPKVDVRAVIIQNDSLLMVKEKTDNCWALPGGWADVGLSPYENVVKEVREEAGVLSEPVRLLAVMDKKLHTHPPSPWYCYKIFILCKIIDGKLSAGMETSDVAFFSPQALPELSDERITKEQIDLILKLALNDRESWCE